MKEVPIWEKSNLTLEEAAAYSGVGINKLRSLSDHERCQFVLDRFKTAHQTPQVGRISR